MRSARSHEIRSDHAARLMLVYRVLRSSPRRSNTTAVRAEFDTPRRGREGGIGSAGGGAAGPRPVRPRRPRRRLPLAPRVGRCPSPVRTVGPRRCAGFTCVPNQHVVGAHEVAPPGRQAQVALRVAHGALIYQLPPGVGGAHGRGRGEKGQHSSAPAACMCGIGGGAGGGVTRAKTGSPPPSEGRRAQGDRAGGKRAPRPRSRAPRWAGGPAPKTGGLQQASIIIYWARLRASSSTKATSRLNSSS
jgi:hypothetical protein